MLAWAPAITIVPGKRYEDLKLQEGIMGVVWWERRGAGSLYRGDGLAEEHGETNRKLPLLGGSTKVDFASAICSAPSVTAYSPTLLRA